MLANHISTIPVWCIVQFNGCWLPKCFNFCCKSFSCYCSV